MDGDNGRSARYTRRCSYQEQVLIDTADYQVEVEGTDPKTGKLESTQDALPVLEVASPPEFGGPGGEWSPEHLFVAAISSCLMTTFQAIAAMSGVEVVSYRDRATAETTVSTGWKASRCGPSGHCRRDQG
jgi:organic hydroperoxide reductase OsmC/OhrA